MNRVILAFLLTITRLISLFPRSIVYKNKSVLAKFLKSQLKRRNRIIKANIKYCFSDKSKEWRDQLVDNIWEESVIGIFENNFAWNASHKRIEKINFSFKGDEILEEALKENKGVILLFKHTLYLELSARLLSTKYKYAAMERPNNNEIIQKLQQIGRAYSSDLVLSNSNIKDCVRELKNNAIVFYVPDQDYRNKRSIISKFFKRKCLSTTVPFALQQIVGSNVVFFDFYREDSKFYIEFKKLKVDKKTAKNFVDMTNLVIEESVLEHPEQYLWHHRRFKSQAPNIYD